MQIRADENNWDKHYEISKTHDSFGSIIQAKPVSQRLEESKWYFPRRKAENPVHRRVRGALHVPILT